MPRHSGWETFRYAPDSVARCLSSIWTIELLLYSYKAIGAKKDMSTIVCLAHDKLKLQAPLKPGPALRCVETCSRIERLLETWS